MAYTLRLLTRQFRFGSLYTMWKFQDFSVMQILRQINFGESRSSESAFFAIFRALTFLILVNFSLQKVQKFIKIKIEML